MRSVVRNALALAVLAGSLLSAVSRADIVRLDPAVHPVEESVALTLDADRTSYSGRVEIQLRVDKAASRIQFHARGPVFDEVVLRPRGASPVDVRIDRGDDGLVTLTPEQALPAGEYTLRIRFHNDFNTQAVGLYRMAYQGKGYLFTQFEAVDARRAFPCWDEPGFKIPWQLTLRVPRQQVAVANTPIQSSRADGEWKIVRFRRTPPLPSYLLALAVGPLESVPIDGLSVPGRIYTVQGQSGLAKMAVGMTPGILRALESYFGRPYPYAKLDLIAIPEFWYGAMENAGAVTFADRILLMDPAQASVADRRRMVDVIAHELAHMWFGDLVTMQWWDDLWLNETFASWMADKISVQLYPELEVDLRGRRRASDVMRTDARPSTRAIRQPVTDTASLLSDVGLSYEKGRAVMEMVEQWIGPDVFQRGIRDYLRAHAWGNATGADLWNALSAASGKDLASVMESFLDQSGLPLIRVSPAGPTSVNISQSRFLNVGVEAPDRQWVLPVHIRFGGVGGIAERTILLSGKQARVDLGRKADWVLPQVGGLGYYRWTVPDSMLRRLAERSAELLAPTERITFVGNAGALMQGGEISGGEYLRLLGEFAADPEPEVTTTLLGQLQDVRGAFVTTALRPQFAKYVRRTLGPVLHRIGLEPRPGEAQAVADMRPHLLVWLGYYGKDPEVLDFARRQAGRYLDDPSAVAPAIVDAALRLSAAAGDASLFDTYQRRFESATNPVDRLRFLTSLGAFESPQLRQRFLAYLLGNSVRPTEIFRALRGGWNTEEEAQETFDWVRVNYSKLEAGLPPEFMAFVPYVAGGCSLTRLQAGREFFSQPEHQAPGTLANLARVADQVTDCVHLRQREGESVADYLREVAGE